MGTPLTPSPETDPHYFGNYTASSHLGAIERLYTTGFAGVRHSFWHVTDSMEFIVETNTTRECTRKWMDCRLYFHSNLDKKKLTIKTLKNKVYIIFF